MLLPAWRCKLQSGALQPRTFVQPLPHPQKVAIFWGGFFFFILSRSFSSQFFPPLPSPTISEMGRGFVCEAGMGPPRASPRIPPHPALLGAGGVPALGAPLNVPDVPSPGVAIVSAVRGGGCAGLRQNNGRGGLAWGGKGGGRSPRRLRAPARSPNWEPLQSLPV